MRRRLIASAIRKLVGNRKYANNVMKYGTVGLLVKRVLVSSIEEKVLIKTKKSKWYSHKNVCEKRT
jgi:hypothetical protein